MVEEKKSQTIIEFTTGKTFHFYDHLYDVTIEKDEDTLDTTVKAIFKLNGSVSLEAPMTNVLYIRRNIPIKEEKQ